MSESSRPTRKRRLPAKYQGGATADEIATFEATSQPLGHTNLPTPPPPAPPTTTPPTSPQQPPKKRGRKPKPRVIEPPVLPAVVVIPEADSLRTAVVRGDADDTEAVFKAAVETMESLYEEAYISDNEEGDPVMKTRRRARLKKPKGMSEAQAEKQREQSAFAASIPDPKTVIFEAMNVTNLTYVVV
ncbi:hypothetical protein N7G274_001832 [Stereocaulon virgatum]|uniref:Uncharacterized protein n=1 Tax=Stereocaulon virgatum TaxID=373712 RepID=A0ABR4AKT9_9LECA